MKARLIAFEKAAEAKTAATATAADSSVTQPSLILRNILVTPRITRRRKILITRMMPTKTRMLNEHPKD